MLALVSGTSSKPREPDPLASGARGREFESPRSDQSNPSFSRHDEHACALPAADTLLPARSSLPAIVRKENVRLMLPAPTGHPIVVALRQARQPLSNDELATAMSCSAGEASKRTREDRKHLERDAVVEADYDDLTISKTLGCLVRLLDRPLHSLK